MKAKDLIKILESVPESEVSLQIGGLQEDDYRQQCAKVELASGECLEYLEIEYAMVHPSTHKDGSDAYVTLVLRQNNYANLEQVAEEFDKIYKKEESV